MGFLLRQMSRATNRTNAYDCHHAVNISASQDVAVTNFQVSIVMRLTLEPEKVYIYLLFEKHVNMCGLSLTSA